MTFSTRRSSALFLAQLSEMKRDFGTLFLNIVFPLMFVLILIFQQFAAPSFKFEVGLVEVRQERGSQDFVQELAETTSVDITMLADRGAAMQAVANGDLHAAFVLTDARFAANRGEIELIVGDRYESFTRIMLDALRDRMRSARQEAGPEAFVYRVANPPHQRQSDFSFQFPGMLALALVQLGLFATAVPLIQARERGTLRYLAMTPLSQLELLVGQLGVRVLIALVQIAAILIVGSVVMELSLVQWLLTLGVSLLGILLMISLGYAIAGVTPNIQVGSAVILFSNFLLMLGGNVFIDPTGSTAQYVLACLLPVSYLADLYRQVLLDQNGLWPVWVDVGALLLSSAAAIFVAVRTFKFDTETSGRRSMRAAARQTRFA